MKTIILFNRFACNGKAYENAQNVEKYIQGNFEYLDLTSLIESYDEYFSRANKEYTYILCGGDGTLNYFINHIKEENIPPHILYYPSGTGNDFYNDLKLDPNLKEGPIDLYPYLVELPTCTIDGKDYKFMNGIGYGIDGYCCEEGDRQKLKSTKPVNYTSIAIKGLLFKYKPTNAKITVDGVTSEYKKVWLAPVMNGRFYGGGMMATPGQDRLNKERLLTSLVWSGTGKLKTLMNFPKIFKGQHVTFKNCVVKQGHEIIVEFDRPVAAQVDGDTVLGVTKIHCKSYKK